VRDSRKRRIINRRRRLSRLLRHDSLALSQEVHTRWRLWRWRVVTPSAVSGAQATSCHHRPCVPVLSVPSYPVVDVTLPARVWELGGRPSVRACVSAIMLWVGRLARLRGAIILVLPGSHGASRPIRVSIVASS